MRTRSSPVTAGSRQRSSSASESVPTLRLSNLTEAQRRAYVIADNKLAQNAGWDRDGPGPIELQALIDVEFDIELTGFSPRRSRHSPGRRQRELSRRPDGRRGRGPSPARPELCRDPSRRCVAPWASSTHLRQLPKRSRSGRGSLNNPGRLTSENLRSVRQRGQPMRHEGGRQRRDDDGVLGP